MNSPFTGFWFLVAIVVLATAFVAYNYIQDKRQGKPFDVVKIIFLLVFYALAVVIWFTQT